MTEEWLLSIADVAEALNCSPTDVRDVIARGDLRVAPGPGTRVTHDELVSFVSDAQQASLALGLAPKFHASFVALRPVRHDNQS